MVLLLVTAAGIADPGDAFGSPARRLARRGVVVVPAPVIVGPAPVIVGPAPVIVGPAPVIVGPPGVVPAPVVVGPPLRPLRWMPVPVGPPFVPEAFRITVREQIRGASAPVATTAPAPAVASAAPAAKPAPSGPEAIKAPLPAPAVAPTVAAPASTTAGPVPFSPAWYESHPQAWRPAQQSADWWRGADLATVTSWLGQPVSKAGNAAAGAGSVTTAGADDVGDDGLRSVLVLPAGHENASAEAAGDWLPLGVFAVVSEARGQDGSQQHNFQQLAVDRKGAISGNFYDAISDTLQPITGSVDRDTLTASWTVGANGSRFTAPLQAFAAAPRTVSVSSGGTTRQLQLLPLPRP
jgi:hypothetical protein